MSEQDSKQPPTKQHRNRKTSITSQENGKPAPAVVRPANDDREVWKAFWIAQGQSWRTESEIDQERQKYLAERRAIAPDVEQGNYPFKDIKLSRADIEWLLATHRNGQGPVYWSDERQQEREGLDLRGANLRGVDLHGLSLAGLSAGFDVDRWSPRHIASIQLAETNLEEVDLSEAHLEGANLRWVHLENSILRGAHLEGADLQYAHLVGGDLREAHLEGTNLRETFMERTNLRQAHLEGADLRYVHFEGANLRYTHLEGKHLSSEDAKRIQKWAKNIPTHLPPADLREAFFDEATNLGNLVLGNTTSGFVKLADVRWDNTNLSYISWSTVKMLGDEIVARQKRQNGNVKDSVMHLNEYEDALRANRQLAVVLRDQGLNEEADHFAYRAQLLQRVVWHLQSRPLKFVLSWFLYLLAGYGYRPGRTVAWYLVVIIGFGLTYHALGGLTLFPPDAFVFSIMSFHGRGFFPSLSGETNLHNPLVMLAAVEAVIGLVIEISFIATFTQRFFGK